MAVTEELLRMLAAGDAGAQELFAADPLVHDPRAGRVSGADALTAFARSTADWYAGLGGALQPVRTTSTPIREVTEQLLQWPGGELPIAVAGDLADDGRLTGVRIYHSSWPLTGSHQLRPAVLAGDPDAVLADVVGDYQRALASKHLDGILATFEPDAYVREPAGGEHTHRGPDARASFYDRLFDVGEIILEHCTVTDDGTAAALEYNVVRWGPKELTPQAGIGVYERGPSGLLAAARIYDDVDI